MDNNIINFDEMKSILMEYSRLSSMCDVDETVQKKVEKYRKKISEQLERYGCVNPKGDVSRISCIENLFLNYIDNAINSIGEIRKHYIDCIMMLNEWYQDEVFFILSNKDIDVSEEPLNEEHYEDSKSLLIELKGLVEKSRDCRLKNDYAEFSKYTFEIIVKIVSLLDYQ